MEASRALPAHPESPQVISIASPGVPAKPKEATSGLSGVVESPHALSIASPGVAEKPHEGSIALSDPPVKPQEIPAASREIADGSTASKLRFKKRKKNLHSTSCAHRIIWYRMFMAHGVPAIKRCGVQKNIEVESLEEP